MQTRNIPTFLVRINVNCRTIFFPFYDHNLDYVFFIMDGLL